MIRPFEQSDIEKIDLNNFGDKDLIKKLDNVLKTSCGFTLERKGIRAILFFRNYAENNYEGILVCSNKMTAFDGRRMKEFIYELMKDLQSRRIETLSLDDKKLNRWHKFLGFECEGIKRKYYKDKDYCVWAILRR